MGIINDELLQQCFKVELEKIPRFFRCGKKGFKRFVIIVAIWLVVDIILGAIPWEEPEIIWIKTERINYPFSTGGESIKIFTLMNIILVLCLLWLEIVSVCERVAFKRASRQAALIVREEKEIERRQELKEKKRLEKAMAELELKEMKEKPAPRFCSKCGFLLPEDIEIKQCPTCGQINE